MKTVRIRFPKGQVDRLNAIAERQGISAGELLFALVTDFINRNDTEIEYENSKG